MWNFNKLFDDLGGPSGVYRLLEPHGVSYSAVRNWRIRRGGIPTHWLGLLLTEARNQDPDFQADDYLADATGQETPCEPDDPF